MSVAAVEHGGRSIQEDVDPIRPMRAFEVRVSAVRQLTPHFRRITFTGPDLELFGTGPGGETLDLRIKVLIPAPGHTLPALLAVRGALAEDWYRDWRSREESVRGVMRTYTVRALRPAAAGRPAELDIDFVLHGAGAPTPAGARTVASGPAAAWALAASPGDPLTVIGPCARWGECLGIEFAPGEARRILLAGDETAVPAIAAILESLPAHVKGHAILEVPTAADFLDLSTNANIELSWLARSGRAHGELLSHGVRGVIAPAACRRGEEPEDVDVDAAILWETPQAAPEHGLYAWLAGEAATIRDLRRYLVRDVGMDRGAVAFMGYWRDGQALPG
ncbi:siderophore-interacting protein [Specibacter sp. RAF43]|uniref:siderophore-interacting protein n=1 Tax=Specibacter sp. RAF43 TaxID=3233057 RepID=UPI003F9A4DC5